MGEQRQHGDHTTLHLSISTGTVTLTVSLLTLNETLHYNSYYRHFDDQSILHS